MLHATSVIKYISNITVETLHATSVIKYISNITVETLHATSVSCHWAGTCREPAFRNKLHLYTGFVKLKIILLKLTPALKQ